MSASCGAGRPLTAAQLTGMLRGSMLQSRSSEVAAAKLGQLW